MIQVTRQLHFFQFWFFSDTHFFASQSRFNANLKLWWWVDWLVDDAEDKIGLQQIFTWRMFCVFTQVDVGVGVGVGVGNASSQGRRDSFLSFDAVATASEKTFDSIDANFCVKTIFSDARQSDSKIRRFNWSFLGSKIRLSHKKLSEPFLWRTLSLSFCCVKVEPNWIQDKKHYQGTNH